mmetsp:Transcript_100774/g.289014  ORF Transcript_100774/g.289014 Transcript_100774/m.289014 type:complete len:207 (-) Transcript_100774:1479-2099(-)
MTFFARRSPHRTHLVHASRTEAGLRASIDRHGHSRSCVGEFLLDPEMRRLITLVVDATSRKVGENVEGDNTIRFRVLDLLELRRRPRFFGIRLGVVERPALLALEEPGRRRSVGKARDKAVVEGAVAVAHLLELLADPVGVHILLVLGGLHGGVKLLLIVDHLHVVHAFLSLVILGQQFEHSLASGHTRLDGRVGALDLDRVKETS